MVTAPPKPRPFEDAIRREVETHYTHFLADLGDLGYELLVISRYDHKAGDVVLRQGINMAGRDIAFLVARPTRNGCRAPS